MLQLIFGRAGAGKTTHLHTLLRDFARGGARDMILLIPEQDSFAAERAMLGLLGEREADAVEALSFTRLADSVFRACGGRRGRPVSDGLRALTMSLALDGIRDRLELFARADERMTARLLDLDGELRGSGVTPAELRRAARQINASSGQKLAELSLILETYRSLLEERFGGQGDAMQDLFDTLAEHRFFAGRIVAVDSFRGFTGQEYRILRHILAQAQAVYVTLCMDTLAVPDEETSVFAHTIRTARKLIALAREADVPVCKPQRLSGNHHFCNFPPDFPRYQTKAMALLESALAGDGPGPFAGETEDLVLCSCEDVEAECAFAAWRIRRLLREQNLRCRDIAVLARDFAAYERPLRAALRRAEIPLFEDQRQPVACQPLMAAARAALELAAEGYSTPAVTRWLKAGLSGLTLEEGAEIENYAYLWHIDGRGWLRDWTEHPGGLGLPWNAGMQGELDRLNALRRRATAPLERLRERMRDCTGRAGAEALWLLLEETDAAAAMKAFRDGLEARGQTAQALEQARIWDVLAGLLDDMAGLLGDETVGTRRFADLFSLLLSYQTLGSIPQGLDEVAAGSADRVRLNAPQAVFLLGCNDGIFPRTPPAGGLLSDADRRQLEEQGVVMQDTAPQQLALERLLGYQAMCAAGRQLTVTFPRRSPAGEERFPSPWMEDLRRLFPDVPLLDTLTLPPLEQLEGEGQGFSLLCERYREPDAFRQSLLAYFQSQPAWRPRLEALSRAASADAAALQIDDPAAAQELFGQSMTLSASRAESYHRCPFQYFCRFGLQAKPRKEADFDPLFRGSAVHSVLEHLLRDQGVDALLALAPPERRRLLDEEMDRYAAEFLRGENLPERVRYLFRRLREILAQVLERLLAEFASSAFRPAAFELVIDRDRPVQPYVIPLEDGGELRMRGVVDRVDCAVVAGVPYFRVVDYKSGGKTFDLSEVYDGLNLQMLIYLFSLWESGAPPAADALPAGILYVPTKDPVLRQSGRDEDPEKLAAEKRKENRAGGLLLEDEGVLCAMEADARGIYLPAHRKSGGALAGPLVTLGQLGRLKRKADGILADMARNLRRGAVPALPYQKGQHSACESCDFAAACGRETGEPARWAKEMKFEDAKQLLEEEADDA